MRIVIIGYGVVGSHMQALFSDAEVHDPAKGMLADGMYDVGFICVPTDMQMDGSADISIVKSAVNEWRSKCRTLCIRSTVPPGTTDLLGKPCIFQPEYYGSTAHSKDIGSGFVILGGDRDLCHIVAEAYKGIFSADLEILFTDSTTAEVAKYMENSWLAMKVTFCNEFARIAATYGVDYDELRELWLHDPRVNRAHTFVYRDHPYYDSHCLNKDIPAIVRACINAGYDAKLLKAVIERNNEFKQ